MRRLVVVLVGVSLLAALPALAEQRAHRQLSLRSYGISITLPRGWHGRIYKRPGGLPILHVGNFALPRGDDDAGTKAIKEMRRASIFIVLLESSNPRAFHYQSLVGPPQVNRRDFLPGFEGVPASHGFARITFTTHRRYFDLWVQFGVRPAPVRLQAGANRVLATLQVTAN